MEVLRILILLAVLFSMAGEVSAQPSHDTDELIFIADDEGEAALAVSTGARTVYGNSYMREEVESGKTVYEIGEDRTHYPEVSAGEVAELAGMSRDLGCPETETARFYSAVVAALNQSEVVCEGNSSSTGRTMEELKEMYVRRVKEEGDGINHIFLSSPELLPAAAAIAADQNAFLSVVGEGEEPVNVSEGFEDGSLEDRWRVWKTGGGSAQVRRSGERITGFRVLEISTEGEGDNGEISINRSVDIDLSGEDVFTAYVRSREFRDSFAFSSREMSHRRIGNFEFGITGDCSFYTHNGTHKTERGCASSGVWYRLNATFHPENDTAEVWWENAGTGKVYFHAEIPRKNLESFDTVHLRSADDERFADEHLWDNVTYKGGSEEANPDAEETRRVLDKAADFLGERGMYIEGREQYLDGLYISLAGVPPANLTDPVEAGNWSISDPEDGRYFQSDLQYGDLDGDGWVDAAVGRYPENMSLASRMYLRSKYYRGKKALVASEYLHQNWPVILAYSGGGMYSGKSIEHLLEGQGYDVRRAVEYRATPEEFLTDLTPSQMEEVLLESEIIGEALGGVLGKSMGVVASKVFVTVKALDYAERGLEQYLEFDWSTAGLDLDRARDRISSKEFSDLEGPAVRAADEAMENGFLAAGLVEEAVKEGVGEAVAKAVYAFFWPDRYGRIGKESLREGLGRSDTAYYAGVGNGSAWILPNNFSEVAGVVRIGRYNGSESFDSESIPGNSLRLVFDNSDLAATGGSQMRRKFLERGAASFVGAASANYAPFSSDIDTRFFREGYTVGQSLKRAVNSFAENSIVWDPFNAVARAGIQGKMMRSFRLFGNPEMSKDPEIGGRTFDEDLDCDGGVCTLELTAELNYSVVEVGGTRTISADSDGTIIRSFRPIVPVLKAKRHLPSGAEVLDYSISQDAMIAKNVSVPVVEPLSHGGRIVDGEKRSTFPENVSRFSVRETVDGRKEMSFAHAAFQHIPEENGTRIYENVELVVRYRTPYEMSVEAQESPDNRANIDFNIMNPRDETRADILLKLNGRQREGETSVSRNLSRGENRFQIPVEVGRERRYEVEAYLFVGNHTVGPRRETFTFGGKIPEDVPEPVTLVRKPSNLTAVWADGFRVSLDDEVLKVSQEDENREVSVVWRGGERASSLETESFRVAERTRHDRTTVRVNAPGGNASIVFDGGGSTVETRGRITVRRAMEFYSSLLDERSELLERYRRYSDHLSYLPRIEGGK